MDIKRATEILELELKTDLNQIDKNSDYDNELIKIEETIKKNKLGLFLWIFGMILLV